MGDAAIDWLLEGDPAIRFQTMRDLLDKPARAVARERRRVLEEGWGSLLMAAQQTSGQWGGGVYTPKWISTTYTLLELRSLEPPPGDERILKGCRILLDEGLHTDGGINLWRRWRKDSETCVSGMALSVCAALGLEDDRLATLARHLLGEQMRDGGWNCRYRREHATHASFHTTISVLEALRDYERTETPLTPDLREAQQRGREFLLRHRLFRSHRTGKVVDNRITLFAYPPRWHYDVLRGLDYFRDCGAERDPRLADAIALVDQRRDPDGRWTLPSHYRGRIHFEYEPAGSPSRWNTLRALRVLRWWKK